MAPKARNSKVLPPAPPWMNPAAKRLFSVILSQEMAWKGHVLRSDIEMISDFVCCRQRIDVLRRMLRAQQREKDVGKSIALSKEISATVAVAQRLAADLRLYDHEEAAAEYSKRG